MQSNDKNLHWYYMKLINIARLITHTKKYDHITPILKELHWLPVEERIIFKNLLLVKKILSNEAPLYLSDFV